MKRVLLVDVDQVSYKLAYFNEPEPALGVTRLCVSLMNRLNADDVRLSASVPTEKGFRKALYPGYKLNRVRPKFYTTLISTRDEIIREHNPEMIDGLEADDVQALRLTEPQTVEERICVSLDKDLKGVPGIHYNPKTLRRQIVSEDQADRFTWFQVLVGDSGDGIKGARGVGRLRALDIIDGVPTRDLRAVVEQTYIAKGHTREFFYSQARCVRMLRWNDYDILTGKHNLNWLYS